MAFSKTILALSATLFSLNAFAAPAAVSVPTSAAPAPAISVPAATPADAQQRKNLEDRLNVKVDSITKLPFNGLYEVRVGNDIGYTDARGDYFLLGQLVDLRTNRDLTKERVDALVEASQPKVVVSELPLDSAIKFVKGNGKRTLVAFEDPNCVFCKRLEKSIRDIDDVTLYVFLYPILGDDSVKKSRDIWCSSDRAKVWDNWMQSATPIASTADCTNPLKQNVELGQRLKVDGTPTMFFANGKRVAGAISADSIAKFLSANSPS